FSITPDGTCTGATCSATTAGPHTVHADDDGVMATASLTVTAGTVTTLTLSPTHQPIPAGGSQTYAAEGFDTYGNDAGDVTSSTRTATTSATSPRRPPSPSPPPARARVPPAPRRRRERTP